MTSVVAAVVLMLGGSGCESLLDVNLPTRLPADALQDPALAQTLVRSTIGDFECAYAGYVAMTGLYTDEWIPAAHWFVINMWATRRPAINGFGDTDCSDDSTSPNVGTYQPLQIARGQGERSLEIIGSHADEDIPNKVELLATVAAYTGYTYTLLGEGYCEMAFDAGPIVQPPDVFALAEERFSTAITLAQESGSDDILNMARVGRARVRVNLGKHEGALADARQVRDGFVYYATYESAPPTRENRVAVMNHLAQHLSVDPRFRNLEVDGVPDPRVPAFDMNQAGQDGHTPLWGQRKYVNASDPIPIAKWQEAQLIIAEIEGGQVAVDAINRLRDAAELPHFSSTDPTEIRAQVLEERRRELFAEGHRISDKIRFPELTWDSGVNHNGDPYADNMTCLPLPDAEVLSNPNVN